MDDLQVQVPLPVRPEPDTRQVFDSSPAAVEAEPMAGIAPAAGTAPAAGNGEGLAPQPEFPPVTSPGGTK